MVSFSMFSLLFLCLPWISASSIDLGTPVLPTPASWLSEGSLEAQVHDLPTRAARCAEPSADVPHAKKRTAKCMSTFDKYYYYSSILFKGFHTWPDLLNTKPQLHERPQQHADLINPFPKLINPPLFISFCFRPEKDLTHTCVKHSKPPSNILSAEQSMSVEQ